MDLIYVSTFIFVFTYLWENFLKDTLVKQKTSNFQFEKTYLNEEKKSFFTKLFNTKDKRYYFLILINMVFYQIGWSIDTGGLIPIRYPITFPLFWYLVMQSGAAYIGFQSRKVFGREKILWIFGCGTLPPLVLIFLFLKRNENTDKIQLEEEDYWENFIVVSASIILGGWFLV